MAFSLEDDSAQVILQLYNQLCQDEIFTIHIQTVSLLLRIKGRDKTVVCSKCPLPRITNLSTLMKSCHLGFGPE